jgi:hypothetical protein
VGIVSIWSERVRPGQSNIKGIQKGGMRCAIKVKMKCNKDIEEQGRQEIRNMPGG